MDILIPFIAFTTHRSAAHVAETKKPGTRAGFFVEKKRKTYPADDRVVGRRAREVMPAAIRALVRTKMAWLRFIGSGMDGSGCFRRPASLHGLFRNATSAVWTAILPAYSAGVTVMRTRSRSPGS
jgi:hypothetical protein